jgi:Carbohydrate esterase, sialic acid-specific acetylesterase
MKFRVLIYGLLALSLVANGAFGVRWLKQKRTKIAAAQTNLYAHGGPTGEGRQQVECRQSTPDKRTAILLILGQSNAANTLNNFSEPSAGVINFSLYDGKCYVAKDPLIGASSAGGNFATLLATQMIERRHYEAVVLVPIAVGSTLIQQWAPTGEHNQRITIAIERLRKAKLEPTHVLWHQGEGNRLDPPESYVSAFAGVLSTIRRDGVRAPVYVAQATICGGPVGEPIRAAQRALVDPAKGVLAGPDTDQLGQEFRYDGCHFDGEGGKRVADLWLSALLGEKSN